MATTAKLPVRDKNPVAAVQDFLRSLLALEDISGVLTPMHLGGATPMPALVTDPDELAMADPLAPAFPMNTAKTVARLTHGTSGERIAAVLKSCEIRAFLELVKLNQGSLDEVVIIGIDCLGAYQNQYYQRFRSLGDDGDPIASTIAFLGKTGGSKETASHSGDGGYDLAKACQACEFPAPMGADVTIGIYGVDLHEALPVMADTPRGEALLAQVGLEDWAPHQARQEALSQAVARRTAQRDQMFEETRAATGSLEKLANYLSGCVNCYNCRVACPVCYCKECVFVTDVFDHKPWQYLGWAKQKGMLKMPTDTVFYHLTRLAHMSTACVGCGQCSNACPNDVPVMELFRSVADRTQAGFDYQPGRSLDEPPPLSVFKEDEFQDVVSHLA